MMNSSPMAPPRGLDGRLPRPGVRPRSEVVPAPPRGTSRIALERIIGLWDYLVDERVGIIRNIVELPLESDDPDFFHYFSLACDTSRFTPLKNFSQNGGVSCDRSVAIAKAMGEAVERYCSAIFRPRDLCFGCYDELHGRAVPPEHFALYRAEQFAGRGFPWKPFTRTARVAWAEATSLLTGGPVYVPAAMVYVPYQYITSSGDTPITQPISTGLACGCSSAEATLSGLCEVIERDAFTLTWQARLSPPSIDAGTLPDSALALIRRLADARLEVRVLDITADVPVPTLLTVAFGGAATSPAIAFAAATDPSPEVALVKSLEELVHTRKFAKHVMQHWPPVPVDVAGGHPQVADQKAHLRFYCPQEAREFVGFLWSKGSSRSFRDVADASGGGKAAELRRVIALLADHGLEPIARDLTTPDIGSLGLSVVRAIVPGMHPLFMGYQNRALGGHRLYEVPRRLGYPGLRPGEPDNPYPHPFP